MLLPVRPAHPFGAMKCGEGGGGEPIARGADRSALAPVARRRMVTHLLDISRATKVVIIGITAVVCIAALVSIAVWGSRRSN